MNLPSVKTLQLLADAYNDQLDVPVSGKELRRVLESAHYDGKLGRGFRQIDKMLNAYGVETTYDRDGDFLRYINMGDTYALTLTQYRGVVRVCSWGDIVERNMKRFS